MKEGSGVRNICFKEKACGSCMEETKLDQMRKRAGEGLYSWHEGGVVGNESLNLGLWDYAQEFGFYSECGTEVMRGYIIFCFRTMSVFPSRL